MNNSETSRNERLKAIIKTEYEKDGVVIAVGGIRHIDGFAFEITTNGRRQKGILLNGKLRRRERRKVINGLLYALKTNYLGDFIQFGNGARGAIVKNAEDLK